jgi:uncharacterized integral membrane protein
MFQVTLVLALILAGVLALFGAQNTETVTLHFLWLTARAMPLSLAILGGAVIGALLSLLVGLPGRVRRARTGGNLKRQNARQETQIAHLHATAAADETATQPALRH